LAFNFSPYGWLPIRPTSLLPHKANKVIL